MKVDASAAGGMALPGRSREINGWLAVTAFALLALVAYVGYTRLYQTAAPTAKPQIATVTKGTVVASVTATGSVASPATSRLAFKSVGNGVGIVSQVPVSVGDQVKQGQLVAKLEDQDLQAQVAQAQAQLASARAKLDGLKAGSRPEDVASAEAAVSSARAKLSQVQEGATAADLQAAESAVTTAQNNLSAAEAKLADLQASPTADDLASAQSGVDQAKANLAAAQAKLETVKAGPTPADWAAANAAVDSARASFKAAQVKLDQVKSGALPADVAAQQAAVNQAYSSLLAAEDKLQLWQNGDTKNSGYTSNSQAVQAVQAAQDSYNAAVARLQSMQTPLPSDLQAALSAVDSAQAAVDQAQAALTVAKVNLGNASIFAPFDGVVNAVSVGQGELASGPVVTLVDPRQVRVDVSLAETDVARVKLGQDVRLAFEALPGPQFSGKVIAIAPAATVQSGVSTYPVSISVGSVIRQQPGASGPVTGTPHAGMTPPAGVTPGSGTPPDVSTLKPGMTATATIVYSQKADVLTVPNRAIRMQGQDRVVDVLVNGVPQTRVVKVGLTGDQVTEITDGLSEGDQVVIQATGTAAANVPGLPGSTPSGPGSGVGPGSGLPH